MPEQTERENEGGDSDRTRPPPPDNPTGNGFSDNQEPQRISDEPKKKHRITKYGFKCIGLIVEILVFAVVCAYSWFAHGQWQAMSGQVDIMKGQLAEMQKSTDANTQAAKAAEASVEEARNNLAFVTANARLDQRAWVTVESARIIKQPALDEAPTVTLHIRNSGKTPARKFRLSGAVYVGDHADIVGRDNEPLGKPSENLIGPSAGADSTVAMRFPITEQKELASVTTNETAYIYVIGIIHYIDVFDKDHRTLFCYRWNEKPAPIENHLFMWAAETGNEAE